MLLAIYEDTHQREWVQGSGLRAPHPAAILQNSGTPWTPLWARSWAHSSSWQSGKRLVQRDDIWGSGLMVCQDPQHAPHPAVGTILDSQQLVAIREAPIGILIELARV